MPYIGKAELAATADGTVMCGTCWLHENFLPGATVCFHFQTASVAAALPISHLNDQHLIRLDQATKRLLCLNAVRAVCLAEHDNLQTRQTGQQ
jgi:hypothetical protein